MTAPSTGPQRTHTVTNASIEPDWIGLLDIGRTVRDVLTGRSSGRRSPTPPTAWILEREATADDEVDGRCIPERWWPNPEDFDPDRRVCIGQSFALLEATLIAAAVTQRYELELVEGTVVEPDATVTLRPKGGLPMRLHRRCA